MGSFAGSTNPEKCSSHRRDLLRGQDPKGVGGDALHPCISAASIIAKEHRDRFMVTVARDFPGFGWETNMGYGTAQHLAALRQQGPTPYHRTSFAPVAQMQLV